jgi:putative ABC transport system substrate-binding protein
MRVVRSQWSGVSKNVFPVALSAMLFALCSSADARQPGKIPRIGYVSASGHSSNPGAQIDAFRQGLRELGYVEGKNILVEYRYTEGMPDRIPSFVAEVVQLKVDVLVSSILRAIRAAKDATKTIPIVMVINADPVSAGLVDSLARPGGNITGLTSLNRDLSGKRLELLKEVVPGMSRVGVLSGADPTSSGNPLKEYETAARALKIPIPIAGDTRCSEPRFRRCISRCAQGAR